jgi:hypothetical protein
MKRNNYSRYFRVFHNDTTVTEISTNDFRRVRLQPANFEHIVYSLPEPLFYGYLTEAKAMEMAKAGALEHINALIAMGKDGELALYEYRFHHYQDLTVNLIEANILESEDEAFDKQLEKDHLTIQPS